MGSLETARKQGASVFLYLVFGLLIAIFVININPGSKGGEGGCGTGGQTYMTIDGNRVGQSSWFVAINNPFITNFAQVWGMRTSEERKYAAAELLIRKELLAAAADERGMRVNSDMVMEEIKKGNFFIGGMRQQLGQQIFDMHDDGSKTWSRGKFDNLIGAMRVTKNSYIEEQTRGMQAALMQDLLASSVRVSKEEARDAYIEQKTTVSYDVVRFDPNAYKLAMKLTDADAARYLAAHEDEVKARFKADEVLYKGIKPQLKLRQIFIAKADEPKPEEKKPDDKKPDGAKKDDAKKDDAKKDDAKKDDKPKKPVGMSIDEAKTKLEAIKKSVAAGSRKFADAATELSTDEVLKANGGDLGWRTADSPGLDDKSLNDAVKTLKPGEMTSPIATDKGVYLIRVDDKRPAGDAKDLTYDQVKLEIAATLAKDAWGKEGAKRAALKALATARAGTAKNLSEMFQESTEDKARRQIEEATKQMNGGAVPQMDVETPDEPMAWKPGDDAGSSGSSGNAAGSGSAKGSAATGSGSGTAAGSGSGSGAPTTPPNPTPAPTPAGGKEIEPTKDDLPQFGDIKPPLKHYGPFSRSQLKQLTDFELKAAALGRADNSRSGITPDLVPVVFDELTAGMLGKRVYEVNGVYMILQVTAKGEASMDEFEKDAKALMARMRLMRAGAFVEDWLRSRCETLAKEEKIRPTEGLFAKDEPDPKDPTKKAPHYRPCMTFHRAGPGDALLE